MNFKTFTIESIERTPATKPTDHLEFQSGVNLIVGERDSGKTTWLKMLNYLLVGDDSQVQDAIGIKLAEKYESIKAELLFSTGEQITVERNWKVPGQKHKIYVNDEPKGEDEFGDYMLKNLNIPIIHYPKGSPYGDRAWPKLSWRTLFRSVYRREKYWSDFVDMQPEVELAAALLQFLGVAHMEFPQSFEKLVEKKKQLQRLEGEEIAYSSILNSIATELIKQKELQVAVTPESLEYSQNRIDEELKSLTKKRQRLIDMIKEERDSLYDQSYQLLKDRRDQYKINKDDLINKIKSKKQRLKDLQAHEEAAKAELCRLERSLAAGSFIMDLKVTHCPICEQEIKEDRAIVDSCILCGKKHIEINGSGTEDRINFEVEQLKEEINELNTLIESTEKDVSSSEERLRKLIAKIRAIDVDLNPAMHIVLEMIPPDLSIIDVEVGRLNEQREQLSRVANTLKNREEIVRKIDQIKKNIDQLTHELNEETGRLNFGNLSQLIEDGMNSYLNALNEVNSERWNKGRLNVKLGPRTFKVSIDGAPLSAELGAASHAICLFSYHYALLKLSEKQECNYPGIVIVDFPVTLADGKSLGGAENYLVEPFIRLCNKIKNVQFIAAGRSFESLKGGHQIELMDAY